MTSIQCIANSEDKPMADVCVEVVLSQDRMSPLSPSMQDKPSLLDKIPVSPTSTTEVFLELDKSLGAKLNMRPEPDQSFLNRNIYNSSDDDISLCCSDDDEMEEEEDLFGLSFVMDEDQESQSSMEE